MHTHSQTPMHTMHVTCAGVEKSLTNTHIHTLMITYTTRHDTWDRNSIFDIIQPNKMKKRKKKRPYKRQNDGRSIANSSVDVPNTLGNLLLPCVLLRSSGPPPPAPLSYSSPPSLHSKVHICYFPLGLFSLSSLVSPWEHNGLCKTISGMRNRCENS